jgi:8-oxo-dGTP pyrophosphatase MutT (NUDIX family)
VIEIVDGRLTWEPTADRTALLVAIGDATEKAFADGARRLELTVSEDDDLARRAALRAGYRLEGRRRSALTSESGAHLDELIFARLATDPVEGPVGFSAIANSTMPRKRLIAHVLVRDSRGRILLCETQFKIDWELPGGIVEAGEPPRAGAIREVMEELGVHLEPGRLLAVDWMPPYLGWEDACELIFDGGTITDDEVAAFTLDTREIRSAVLVDLPDAEPNLTPLSFRRLTAILAAEPGTTLVMENGIPIR